MEQPGKMKSILRRFARQRNIIGFACSALLWWKRDGFRAMVRKVKLFFGRKYAERRFVRRLLNPPAAELARQRAENCPEEITFSLIVPLYNTPEAFLREMIRSVQDQTFSRWELCLADGSDGNHPEVESVCREEAAKDPRIRYRKLEKNGGISENSNAALEMATGSYIALFDHDDLLPPSALYEMAKAIREQDADYYYSDEMVFVSPDPRKPVGIHFKPDYAPDDLLANNYICHLSVFRASLMEKAGQFRKAYDGSQDHDLMLRLTDAAKKVVHIPKVLYLWRSHAASVAGDIGSKPYAVDSGVRAVRDFLESKGIAATVESSPVFPTMYHVKYPVSGCPEISIITESGKTPEETERTAERLRQAGYVTEVISCEDRNAAAAQARGEYLLFLAAGLETDNPAWTEEMLMLAQRPDVGAVGGRVDFEDGRVRHAGIILGLGIGHTAGRSHYQAADGAGYFGQLAITEELSAVSGECLMIRKEVFREAGGFRDGFGAGLGAADLCLRLREKGCRILYTPYTGLKGGEDGCVPLELGAEEDGYPEKAARFRDAWKVALDRGDPFYNPNLTLDLSDYRVKI